jgi:hypothetical protein
MSEKKKKNKKQVKSRKRDLKPRKDAKGGGLQFQRVDQGTSQGTTHIH